MVYNMIDIGMYYCIILYKLLLINLYIYKLGIIYEKNQIFIFQYVRKINSLVPS